MIVFRDSFGLLLSNFRYIPWWTLELKQSNNGNLPTPQTIICLQIQNMNCGHKVMQLLLGISFLWNKISLCKPLDNQHPVEPCVLTCNEIVFVTRQPFDNEVFGLQIAVVRLAELDAERFVFGVVPGDGLGQI